MTDTVDMLRAEVLALWNAHDAHEARSVEMDSEDAYQFVLRFQLADGSQRKVSLSKLPATPQHLIWQLALDTLRRATADMERRRKSAPEEKPHG